MPLNKSFDSQAIDARSSASELRPSRRQAIKSTAAAAAVGYWMATRPDESRAAANDIMNVACIGIGGRGRDNLNGISREKVNIVALCDVDDQRAGDAYTKFPKAKKYYDWRKMYDDISGEFDAVVVSTPDHTHFHPSMGAMQLGKHLYCEKPMAHCVSEVRQMTELAAKQKVATQLGVQRHTIENMHRVVELIQAGAIGPVTEVHSWVGGDRGMPSPPKGEEQAPPSLKWDLWLGPTAERPYSRAYCPYGWRFWWDFGTGETGNWGCHILDIPFWALGLKCPTRVEGSGPEVDPERTPKSMTTRFEFPAEESRPAVSLHWYHAKNGPEVLKRHGLSDKGANTLFIGEKGMLLCGFTMRKLLPEEQFKGYVAPAETIPNSPGFYREWVTACHGGQAATCDFAYSGPLSETVLLGNVAYRSGGFDWNAASLTADGNATAQALIADEYRQGWA